MKKNTIKAILTTLIAASAVTYLLMSGDDDTVVCYKTVEEVVQNRENFETVPVRVNGLLVEDSVLNKPGTDNFVFLLKKNDTQLRIEYSGILPDSMKVNEELIAQGTLKSGENTFMATEILTKCPSKYEEEAKAKNR